MTGLQHLVTFILVVAMVGVSGCQSKSYEPIEAHTPLIMVVNYLEQSLSFYHEETAKELTRWEMPFPFTGVCLLSDNQTLLFYGKALDGVYLYNLASGKQTGKWKVGKGIANAVLSADGSTVYLASHPEDAVLVMDQNGHLRAKIAVGNDPLTMVESRHNELYVLNFHDTTISVVNLSDYRLKKTWPAIEGALGAALIESTGELWTGGHGAGSYIENQVTVYSIETGQIKEKIDAPIMPIDMEPVGSYVYVISHGSNQLRKIDHLTKKVVKMVEIGSNPFDIAFHNQRLYCVSYDSDELYIIEPDELKIVDTLPTGKGPFQVLFREGGKDENAKSADRG